MAGHRSLMVALCNCLEARSHVSEPRA